MADPGSTGDNFPPSTKADALDAFRQPGRITTAETAELRRRQRGKNIALVAVLVALVLLFYAIAIVKFKVS